MSDTPGEVRIRVEAAGDRPPLAAARAASDDAPGAAGAERRRGPAVAFGASTATDGSESAPERRRIERPRATPT